METPEMYVHAENCVTEHALSCYHSWPSWMSGQAFIRHWGHMRCRPTRGHRTTSVSTELKWIHSHLSLFCPPCSETQLTWEAAKHILQTGAASAWGTISCMLMSWCMCWPTLGFGRYIFCHQCELQHPSYVSYSVILNCVTIMFCVFPHNNTDWGNNYFFFSLFLKFFLLFSSFLFSSFFFFQISFFSPFFLLTSPQLIF